MRCRSGFEECCDLEGGAASGNVDVTKITSSGCLVMLKRSSSRALSDVPLILQALEACWQKADVLISAPRTCRST